MAVLFNVSLAFFKNWFLWLKDMMYGVGSSGDHVALWNKVILRFGLGSISETI